MSIEKVTQYFKTLGIEDRIQTFDVSSATVELAAKAVGTEGARIAKTLSFMLQEGPILIVAAGDARIDNKKYKSIFSIRFFCFHDVLNSYTVVFPSSQYPFIILQQSLPASRPKVPEDLYFPNFPPPA